MSLLAGLEAGTRMRLLEQDAALRQALVQQELAERQGRLEQAGRLRDALTAALQPPQTPQTPAPSQASTMAPSTPAPISQEFFGSPESVEAQQRAFAQRYGPRQASSTLVPAPDEGSGVAVIEPTTPATPPTARSTPEQDAAYRAGPQRQRQPTTSVSNTSVQAAPGDTTGIQRTIVQEAVKRDIDPALALSLFEVESNYNNSAINPTSKAFSIGQFLPSTAKSRGLDADRLKSDPAYAITSALDYFKELRDAKGDTNQALWAYGGATRPETRTAYTDKIFGRYQNNLVRAASLGGAATRATAPAQAPAPGVQVASAEGPTLTDVSAGGPLSDYEYQRQFTQRYNGQQPLQMAPPENAAALLSTGETPASVARETTASPDTTDPLRKAGWAYIQYGSDPRLGLTLIQAADSQRTLQEQGLLVQRILSSSGTSDEMRQQAMAALGGLLAKAGQQEAALKLIERSLPLSQRETLASVTGATRDILLSQQQSGQPLNIRTALDEQEAQKAREKQAQDSQVVETADGTFVVDKKTGMATRVTEGPRAPGATLTAPSSTSTPPTAGTTGKPLPGKPLTSEQGKSFNFGARAYQANLIVNELEDAGTTGSAFWPQMIEKSGKYGREFGGTAGTIIGIVGGGALGGALSGGAGTVPGALVGAGKGAVAGAALGATYTLMADWFANWLRGPEEQQYAQARLDFISAVLRKESGAAISVGEFVTEEKRFFPAPSDSPQVIRQKRQARATALAAFANEAGRPLQLPKLPQPVQTPEQAGIVQVPGSEERVRVQQP
jgi:hypothetical protein